jgi:hypothetical protein
MNNNNYLKTKLFAFLTFCLLIAGTTLKGQQVSVTATAGTASATYTT